jgi:hypothetical protein
MAPTYFRSRDNRLFLVIGVPDNWLFRPPNWAGRRPADDMRLGAGSSGVSGRRRHPGQPLAYLSGVGGGAGAMTADGILVPSARATAQWANSSRSTRHYGCSRGRTAARSASRRTA